MVNDASHRVGSRSDNQEGYGSSRNRGLNWACQNPIIPISPNGPSTEQDKEVVTHRWFGVSSQACSSIVTIFEVIRLFIAIRIGQINNKCQW